MWLYFLSHVWVSCSHEFAVKVRFDVNHHSKRWLCRQKFEELYIGLNPYLHVKQTYKYFVSEDNIDEDFGNKMPSDKIVSQYGDSNLHNVDLPQHRNVNKEGTYNTNY